MIGLFSYGTDSLNASFFLHSDFLTLVDFHGLWDFFHVFSKLGFYCNGYLF